MINISIMTDQEITAGIKEGSMQAYKQLFLKYYVPVRRFLTVVLSDFEMAQDVAQDIFLKVWLNRDGLSEEKSIKSLVYTMARNAAINHLKQTAQKIGDIGDYVITSSETTDKVEADSLQSYLLFKIAQMPEKRRKIFMMSRYDCMKNKDIAVQLGISVRTVEKHIELALKDLNRGDKLL
jgi:RNA polymerase sigma-70 factor (ECF subfamily)